MALEALAARAAHAVNNALNGATVNVEVVRIRARAAADRAGAAPFAEAAAGELERANALAAALLVLARAPRGQPDVVETLRQVAALLGPALEERGVTLRVEPTRERGTTAAPAHALRLALVRTLLALGDASAGAAVGRGLAAEPGGADSADESVRLLRCTFGLTPTPTVRLDLPDGVAPGGTPLDAADLDALRGTGVGIRRTDGAFVLDFPAP
ncbi:hypothetical protein PYV61_10225 [Roseisolibacter sp. H3M3-2]|nr:hypothetical protein [Roseisolibacter sp. H3M3-2]